MLEAISADGKQTLVNDEKLLSEDETRSSNDGRCCSASRTVQYMCVKRLLNQCPRRCSLNGAVVAVSWFPLTMGKTGQGFLPPQTHPLSQHRPQAPESPLAATDTHTHTVVNHLCVYKSLYVSGEAPQADPPPYSVSSSAHGGWSDEIRLFLKSPHFSTVSILVAVLSHSHGSNFI